MARRKTSRLAPDPDFMRPYEVANLLGCASITVKRWADAGYLPSYRSATGQRRYPRAEIMRMVQDDTAPRPWRAGDWDQRPEGPVTRQPPKFQRFEQTDALEALEATLEDERKRA